MRPFLTLLLVCCAASAFGQSKPATSTPPAPSEIRPIPPPGIEVPATDIEALKKGLAELRQLIDEAVKTQTQTKNPRINDLLPDIEIFYKSVSWAIAGNEFFNKEHIKAAYEQIAEGKKRAEAFKNGDAPWTRQKGFVVRAYRSKIDGSIQPYGMSIPESYHGAKTRLDVWLRGRSEKGTELAFVDDRSKRMGPANPPHTLVLHPYGRYCCANKITGEADLFEALNHARKFYNFDENRMNVRGFSMGGAATWQFATHYPAMWCAATPGAGFAETPEFLKMTPEQLEATPWFQKKLWHLYNATDYALNLANLPTIAYSGEIDGQKQAADVMTRELQKENLHLLHLIGPQTAHKLHPESLAEIEERLAAINSKGRDRAPRRLHFTTWTLRYNQAAWLTIDGLGEHWERARVDGEIKGDDRIELTTKNITALTINFAAGQCPLDLQKEPVIAIDGITLKPARVASDLSWTVPLVQKDSKWSIANNNEEQVHQDTLAKVHGLQGPIDDAFWDSVLFVTPTSEPIHANAGQWVESELQHAVREWRLQFRGDVPQVKDSELSDAQIASNHLILWGDPSSNATLKKIVSKLPIQWTANGLVVNGKTYSAEQHVPALIFPNPLNPKKYVVINSSFTYREFDYLNNARQVPKLPDWAVISLAEKPDAYQPGKILDAGFFDEQWQFKSHPEKTN